MKKFDYYTPSGRISISAYPTLALFAFLVFPLLGFVYAYLQSLSGYLLIHFALFIGCCLALAFLFPVMLAFAKVRNFTQALVTSTLCFFTFYYTHWVAFIDFSYLAAIMEYMSAERAKEMSDLLLGFERLMVNPDRLWTLMGMYRESYTFDFFFWVFTGIEFVFFILIMFAMGSTPLLEPFSEINNSWHDKLTSPRISALNKHAFLEALSHADYQYFENLTAPSKSREDYSLILLYTSPGDQTYVTLKTEKVETGANGAISFNETTEIEYVAIDTTMEKKIREVFERCSQQQPTEPVEEPKQPETTQVAIAEEATPAEIIPEKEEPQAPEERIEKPVLVIDINQGKRESRYFGAFISVIVGAGLVYFSSGEYTHTEGLIFGALLFVVGLIQLLVGIGGRSRTKLGYAIKLTPSTMVLSGMLTSDGEDRRFDLAQLKEVSSYAGEGSVTLTLITKDEIFNGRDYLKLDILLVDYTWKALELEFAKLAQGDVYERKALLEDWLQRKPSLRF